MSNRFDVLMNPNGIVYNPISIAEGIRRALDLEVYTDSDVVEANELFYSWDHHGKYASLSQSQLLSGINDSLKEYHQRLLNKRTTLLITFGSAWVHEYQGRVVANCHKIPQQNFTKRMLAVSEIVMAFEPLLQTLDSNQVVFTVSPVRYIKDGVHESTLSKSVLHLAIEELRQRHSNVHYFPAYEIVVDELRDYRFYAEDLVHPSSQAVDYVWSAFLAAFVDDESRQMTEEWSKVSKLINHRQLHPDTEAAILFKAKAHEELARFNTKFDFKSNH